MTSDNADLVKSNILLVILSFVWRGISRGLGLSVVHLVYICTAVLRKRSSVRLNLQRKEGKSLAMKDIGYILLSVVGSLLCCAFIVNLFKSEDYYWQTALNITFFCTLFYCEFHGSGMVVPVVTGGIASGKSSFCAALEKDGGYSVVDADRTYLSLLKKGSFLHENIVSKFGRGVLTVDSEGIEMVDKVKLGILLREDPAALNDLNSISHPFILINMLSELWSRSSVKNLSREKMILEVPLLFETKFFLLLAAPIINIESGQKERLDRYERRARQQIQEMNNQKGKRKQQKAGKGQMQMQQNKEVNLPQVRSTFKDLNSRQVTDEFRKSNSDITVVNDGAGLKSLEKRAAATNSIVETL